MKITLFTAFTLIALMETGAAQPSQASATAPAPTPAKHLTRRQAEHLVNTANTTEEHRALAQYFRQEAQRKRDQEQYFMEVVATYRQRPPRVDSYRNTPTRDRYEQMADEARDEALADDRRACLQEQFAEGLATPR
jgi:hypothetical protein